MFGSRPQLGAVMDAVGPVGHAAPGDRALGGGPPARSRVGLVLARRRGRHAECDRVRVELGEGAEGLTKLTTSVRRHLELCEHCAVFKNRLYANNRVLAAIFRRPPFWSPFRRWQP